MLKREGGRQREREIERDTESEGDKLSNLDEMVLYMVMYMKKVRRCLYV